MATSKPRPFSSRYSMTPPAASSPKALPPEIKTACTSLTRGKPVKASIWRVLAAEPRISALPTVPGGQRITVQPVTPLKSLAWPSENPGTRVIMAEMEIRG